VRHSTYVRGPADMEEPEEGKPKRTNWPLVLLVDIIVGLIIVLAMLFH
jgi:hypothetical protein